MVDETRFASSVAVSHGHPFKALRLFGFSQPRAPQIAVRTVIRDVGR